MHKIQTIGFSLVSPALFHQGIHSLWTDCWTVHSVPTFNEANHLWSFHFLGRVEKDKSCKLTFRTSPVPSAVTGDFPHDTVPYKVSLHRKRPPTWLHQNSTHHFYWRICGSLYILGRTTLAAIYLQYEPVQHNTYDNKRLVNESSKAAYINIHNYSKHTVF